MRKLIMLIVAAVGVAFLADAQAATFEQIKGKVSKERLAGACSAAGGDFNSNSSGYSCETKNCNGKGGTCGVYCDNSQQCTGTTPGIHTAPGVGPAAADLHSILTDRMGRESAGSTSGSGTTKPTDSSVGGTRAPSPGKTQH